MTAVKFDTLKFVEQLKAGGLPEAHARAMAEALKEANIDSRLSQAPATKADVALLEAELKLEIAKLKVDLIQWFAGKHMS